MRVALTIAGSDSSGGAGIQADLKTFQAHGVFGMSAVTAVTVQNTQKVYDIQEIQPKIVHDQIICLFDDIEIHAVKIGMVSSIELIQTIAKALKAVKPPAIVLDPVMISKSGYRLLNQDAQDALTQYLFPLAEVVTPNIYEAEALIGKKIAGVDDMKSTAIDILKLGSNKVVVKGDTLKKTALRTFSMMDRNLKRWKASGLQQKIPMAPAARFLQPLRRILPWVRNFSKP